MKGTSGRGPNPSLLDETNQLLAVLTAIAKNTKKRIAAA